MAYSGIRLGSGLVGFATVIGVAVACSDQTSLDNDLTADGGPMTTSNGSCPCTVGNSSLQFTISCGGAQCISLNGAQAGYRCDSDGPHADDTVCASEGGSTTNCAPKTCAVATSQCGTVEDGCGSTISCPCPTAQNIVVYGNLQGGTYGIAVDQNLPGLAICIVSSDNVNITLSGPYLSNVVAVYYAGNAEPSGVVVTGIDATKVFAARLPSATVDAGITNAVITCEDPPDAGFACNPAAQVNAFFGETLGGNVVFNRCQEAPFTGTLKVSDQGSCN